MRRMKVNAREITTSKPILNSHEVAGILNITIGTLALWRQKGKGPPYIRYHGQGRCYYQREALEAWIDQHSIQAIQAQTQQEQIWAMNRAMVF